MASLGDIDQYENWEALRTVLKEKFKSIFSYDIARENISEIQQNQRESVEEYSVRARKLLEDLNKANSGFTDQAEIRVVKSLNEKLAITKFKQNIFNDDLRILVQARKDGTLEEAITHALEQDMGLKQTNLVKCNYYTH